MAPWNPEEWSERTRKLTAEERGVLADLRNLTYLRMAAGHQNGEQMSANLDTWEMLLRMDKTPLRRTLCALEAAGVISTRPRPDTVTYGNHVLMIATTF